MSLYSIKLVLQLYVFVKAVASYMLFLIKVFKSSEMTLQVCNIYSPDDHCH